MRPLQLEGCVTYGDERSWATLSECGRYRYALGRSWDPIDADFRSVFSVFMLNPSTADHCIDDPTIRKCIRYAKQEGCGSLLVRNLFAWRATDPKELRKAFDPHGPCNEAALQKRTAIGPRVAAWGALAPKWLRQLAVAPMCIVKTSPTLYVLGLTDDGQPRHPLYLPNATRITLWSEATRQRAPKPEECDR